MSCPERPGASLTHLHAVDHIFTFWPMEEDGALALEPIPGASVVADVGHVLTPISLKVVGALAGLPVPFPTIEAAHWKTQMAQHVRAWNLVPRTAARHPTAPGRRKRQRQAKRPGRGPGPGGLDPVLDSSSCYFSPKM